MAYITCPYCVKRVEFQILINGDATTGELPQKKEEPIGHLKVVSLIDWEIHKNVVENLEYKYYIFSGMDKRTGTVILEKVCYVKVI